MKDSRGMIRWGMGYPVLGGLLLLGTMLWTGAMFAPLPAAAPVFPEPVKLSIVLPDF